MISRLKTDGPFNATGFLATLNYTLDQALVAYAFQDIADYFVGGISDIEGSIPLQAINRDGIMGYHGVPQMPLFAYKAIGDEVSVINDTDALVDKYCGSKCSFWGGGGLINQPLGFGVKSADTLSSWGQYSLQSQYGGRALRRGDQRAPCSLGLVVECLERDICRTLFRYRLYHTDCIGQHHVLSI